MISGAPRLPWRPWHGPARGAWLALSLWLAAPVAAVAAAETIVAARFAEPTAVYDHAILGDALEWRTLEIDTTGASGSGVAAAAVMRRTTYRLRLPPDHVFEDIAPRLVDVTGDGAPEVIVVETDVGRGAALAVYDARGKVAETPHIGQRNRWLAPVGAADLDGDGRIEIAYVDRPHLAKVLRVWRLERRRLVPVADLAGLSNHRIGWDFIAGGLRDCGAGPEMILADADWARVMAVKLGDGLSARALGSYRGPDSLTAALACR